jgi:hypothetical protein
MCAANKPEISDGDNPRDVRFCRTLPYSDYWRRFSQPRGEFRGDASPGNKKTPERFLVPGPFRSAGAFIVIVAERTPTPFFPHCVLLFLASRNTSEASRVPK